MPERNYDHRDVVDKLGVKPGHAVVLASEAGPLDEGLRERVLAKTARPEADPDEPVDVALVTVDAGTDAAATLARWRRRLRPAGAVWLLSPKRGRPHYVDQRELIAAGQEAGLVNNKSCSVSDTTSAFRFVIRRADRPAASR